MQNLFIICDQVWPCVERRIGTTCHGSLATWIQRSGVVIFLLLAVFIQSTRSQHLTATQFGHAMVYSNVDVPRKAASNAPQNIYLAKAVGNLAIGDLPHSGTPSTDTYEIYFHIPISFEDQVPILLQVDCPHLIDFRFLELNPPNIIGVARLRKSDTTHLVWTSWVLIKENFYTDLPQNIPMPTVDQLPDSVKPWLQPTDCVQIEDPFVQTKASIAKGSATTLDQLAANIRSYDMGIPWEFPHSPFSGDALYAMKWGCSCAGHAHAEAAAFRANGIPARILLNIPQDANQWMDHHWISEYFVPNYGWVKMETRNGTHVNWPSQMTIVTFACNPEDEFPVFQPMGVENQWHSSDPALGMLDPNWDLAHRSWNVTSFGADSDSIVQAYDLTKLVFSSYTHCWGISLDSAQHNLLQSAYSAQQTALADFEANDLASYIRDMQSALSLYNSMTVTPISNFFADDFESGTNGWTHGAMAGAVAPDEWTLGIPADGPGHAHSGQNCWRSAAGSTYKNLSDSWLLSPEIDLTDASCAYLSFWLWNSVQDWPWISLTDTSQYFVSDPLWMEITKDGSTFVPLCSAMGGVNDDPAIPTIGGWTKIVLDLTKYGGHNVQVRFRFKSDSTVVKPGSYIDDFQVYGRKGTPLRVMPRLAPTRFALEQNYPNPFNPSTTIRFDLRQTSLVTLEIFNVLGQKVDSWNYGIMNAGRYDEVVNMEKFASGVYYYRISAVGDDGKKFVSVKKLVLMK